MDHALDLVLVWHMHQPDYRDFATGEFREPWVYLHALKDYSDMAWHLEHHDAMRTVVNFTPVLLDQLEDYSDQFASNRLRDPLLRLLARDEQTALSTEERAFAINSCFHANHHKMIRPFGAYARLQDLCKQVEAHGSDALGYLSDRYVYDLIVWYHLAWSGETVRRNSQLVTRLMAKGYNFTHADRRALFTLVADVVSEIIPRWRRLGGSGRIELSTTPHYHPIGPLLIDLACARESEPRAPLPVSPTYPGGRERVEAHLASAIETHARRFGEAPEGVWPAEGGVSSPFVRLLAARGVMWTATGEAVLAHSVRQHARREYDRPRDLYRPYRFGNSGQEIAVFFRDERLSDLIGFEYQRWIGPDAASNLVAELEAIASQAPAGVRPVVSLILDGENPWEAYPYNGWYFLDALYSKLETHAAIRSSTYRAYLRDRVASAEGARKPIAYGELPGLTAGSWVYGTFSTWIGSTDKNLAWDLLVAAKQSYDLVMASGRLDAGAAAEATRQLADCEGSDWFWWFGDYNPAHAVSTFDRLYRAKLANLYHLLGLPPPKTLEVPVSRGAAAAISEASGTMRRATA